MLHRGRKWVQVKTKRGGDMAGLFIMGLHVDPVRRILPISGLQRIRVVAALATAVEVKLAIPDAITNHNSTERTGVALD
jgi:hypothetical protein